MISFFEANIKTVSVHRVGNKLQDEYFALSASPLSFKDELLDNLLLQYFLSPFDKVHEVYRLFHPNDDLNLNEIFHFVSKIFDDGLGFHDQTKEIARHLFESSNHPKIKSGELYVVHFNNVQIEGELLDAVGIFKSETKETFLKVETIQEVFSIRYEEDGINLAKLDKGCLIFKTEKEQGYKVAVVDQTSRGSEAAYWKDDFLKLKIRNDSYNQTSTLMGVYKNFVTAKLDEDFEISKADKIDLLNRSVKYFKEKEVFNLDEFGQEVIGSAEGIKSFVNFKGNYQQDHEMEIGDVFDISSPAVKKQARVFKSVLKLDRNFHIYIHGNKDYIEKGYDDEKNLNFYKVYFKEEE